MQAILYSASFTSGVNGSCLFLLPNPSAKMSLPLCMIATLIPGMPVWFRANSMSTFNFARIASVLRGAVKMEMKTKLDLFSQEAMQTGKNIFFTRVRSSGLSYGCALESQC